MYPIKANSLTVTSGYGARSYIYQGRQISDFHKGIDLVGGSEIVAFDKGVVTGVCNTGEQYGQACYVRIRHDSGWQTLYYHLKSGSVCVSVGQEVSKGQKLGIIGATGQATGVHLHFQIDKGNSASAIDPYDYVFNGKEFETPTPAPTEEGLKYKVGDKVRFTGVLYADSYGNGAGQSRSNIEATIYLTNPKGTHPYNINNGLGWVREQDLSPVTEQAKTYYTVVSGDTLWAIAKRFYGNGSRYPEIAQANNIANPDIIHVGQVLLIP